jgi:hypothetical protein
MAKRKVRVYISDPNVNMLQNGGGSMRASEKRSMAKGVQKEPKKNIGDRGPVPPYTGSVAAAIAASKANSYQQGGGAVTQPQIDQEQLMQLIQAFAQATQQDPQMVMEQVASLQGEQLQQAIQQMTQVVQQGSPAQQGPPQQMAQQMPPQPMSPEMARDGGYIEEYAKKIKKLMSKKTGGITSSDTQATVQKKNQAIIENAIGKNFADNMIDNAGQRFMERASNPRMFAAGGGFDNPFLSSYNMAMDDAMMNEMQSDELRRNRWADLTGSIHTYDQLKAKGVTPEGEKIKGKWNIYDNPYDAQGTFDAMFNTETAKRGGQLPMYQEEGEVKYTHNPDNNTYEFVDETGITRVINAPIDKSSWEGVPDYNPYGVPLRDNLSLEKRKRAHIDAKNRASELMGYTYNEANNTYEFKDEDGNIRVINAPIDKSSWEGTPDYNPYNVPLRKNLPHEVRKKLAQQRLPSFQRAGEYDWQNSVNYDNYPENAPRVTLAGTADETIDNGDVAVYTDEKKPGDPGYDAWVTSKVRGDWSKAFENLQLKDVENKYGIFGRPGKNIFGKEKTGRPRKTTFHFGYGDAPAGDVSAAESTVSTTGKAQWDYNSWDDLRGMLEKDMDVSLNPNLTEGELFEMAKEQGLVGQAQQEQKQPTDTKQPTTADDEQPSNVDRKGRLTYPSQRAVDRRDRKFEKYMEREERRRDRQEKRSDRAYADMFGTNPDGTNPNQIQASSNTGLSYLDELSPAEKQAMLAGTPIYRGGGMIPMYENGGFEPYLDLSLKEDKVGVNPGMAAGWGMALASNLADKVNAAQIQDNESTAYLAALNNPFLPADHVGSRGSFADTTGAPTFQRDRHMGFTGGYWGADQPAQYPAGAYYGRDGGSMGGYDMNQDVYLNTDEIEFILKNGGKVEYL